MRDTYWILLHQQYRDIIKHEDNLIGSRMGWMSAVQAVLFALFFSDDFTSVSKEFVAVLGVVIAGASLSGVYFAQKAINSCVDSWESMKAANAGSGIEDLPSVIGFTPRRVQKKLGDTPGHRQRPLLRWTTPALGLTFSIFLLWGALLGYSFSNQCPIWQAECRGTSE